jgi:hypothetical protein
MWSVSCVCEPASEMIRRLRHQTAMHIITSHCKAVSIQHIVGTKIGTASTHCGKQNRHSINTRRVPKEAQLQHTVGTKIGTASTHGGNQNLDSFNTRKEPKSAQLQHTVGNKICISFNTRWEQKSPNNITQWEPKSHLQHS